MISWAVRALSLAPKLAARIRGAILGVAIRAAGGQCGRRLRVSDNVRFRQGLHAGIIIGNDVYLGYETTVDCPLGGQLRLGNDVTLTQGVFISAARNVSIGDGALVGEYSSIRDANHERALSAGPIFSQPMRALGVAIAADVWLGRGCAVLAGSNVGEGAVIGANSVVRGSIPANVIAAGVPARVLRERA